MDEKIKENIIIYDWLSFTTKIHSIADIQLMLGLEKVDSWQLRMGRFGYKSRIEFEHIAILYDGHSEDMGICVDMSGKGCRAFESFGNGDYEALFSLILSEPGDMKITRLDIAYDDHTGILDLDKLFIDSSKKNKNFVSKFKRCKLQEEYDEETDARTIYHGSDTSETLIRIYDKAQERGYTEEDGKHWIRCEILLRRKNAESFIRIKGSIGKKYAGVINNYVRYVKKTGEDTNKWRWEMTPYWKKFTGSAEKIKLYQKPGVKYNAMKLHGYVVGQAGNSINTYREIYGDDALLKALDEQKIKSAYNDKQKRLINEHKQKSKPISEETKEAAENDTYIKGYTEVKDKDFHQDKFVLDSYGRRWIKCGTCGKIDTEPSFISYGGKDSVNYGVCRSCSKAKARELKTKLLKQA